MLPVFGNPDPQVIEVGSRRRIERESDPEADQDEDQRQHLGSHSGESEQKQKDVPQSNLR